MHKKLKSVFNKTVNAGKKARTFVLDTLANTTPGKSFFVATTYVAISAIVTPVTLPVALTKVFMGVGALYGAKGISQEIKNGIARRAAKKQAPPQP